MPRDDLSIDFVRRMPVGESIDPALILDEWINRTQNLPEEIRFIQDEIQEKDRIFNECVKTIEDRDARIQKWIKTNGSGEKNPREAAYHQTIRENYERAEKLQEEKLILGKKLQYIMDKHTRNLDIQLRILYDRNEPGFTDPDELPSLVRPSAANQQPPSGLPATNPVTIALNPIPNGASQSAIRQNPTIRITTNLQTAAASAPATPAASMILNRKERENSAGPGSGVPRKAPRSVTGLGNAPATSSGLARHNSLGPGTPKLANQHHSAATAHVQRAGSAGPRASSKGGAAGVRKSSTPVPGGRKKGHTPVPTGTKSGLSRVKRASKNSPTANADSELSDAESGSGDESLASRRGTPVSASIRLGPGNHDGSHDKEGSGSGRAGGGSAGHSRENSGHRHRRNLQAEEDEMDVDDEEAGDDKKYCICQSVSYGDMVACDNEACPYEWFHWGCVGLKAEPTGTWYCPVCTEERKRKGLKA